MGQKVLSQAHGGPARRNAGVTPMERKTERPYVKRPTPRSAPVEEDYARLGAARRPVLDPRSAA